MSSTAEVTATSSYQVALSDFDPPIELHSPGFDDEWKAILAFYDIASAMIQGGETPSVAPIAKAYPSLRGRNITASRLAIRNALAGIPMPQPPTLMFRTREGEVSFEQDGVIRVHDTLLPVDWRTMFGPVASVTMTRNDEGLWTPTLGVKRILGRVDIADADAVDAIIEGVSCG